jgi:hypothetical protein
MHKNTRLTKKINKKKPPHPPRATTPTPVVRSLQPAPGGELLADYAAIKAGHYNGPPLQYTATTALKRDFATGVWDLAPGFKLFSNEHDPRLQDTRDRKQMKVTRYAFSSDLTARASWHEPGLNPA